MGGGDYFTLAQLMLGGFAKQLTATQGSAKSLKWGRGGEPKSFHQCGRAQPS